MMAPYLTAKHPQAKAALWLAHYLDGAPPHILARALIWSGCPLYLFELAVRLRKS